MAIYVCEHCRAREPNDPTHNNENYITETPGEFSAAGVECRHCGQHTSKCFHPGGIFDKSRQTFVCECCGEADYDAQSFARLRNFAKDADCPDLRTLIDCTDH